MNPSYVRLRVAQEAAMPRFSAWLGLPELEPPAVIAVGDAVDRATRGGSWRGVAFFVYENDGWTIFEDLTGHLGTKSAEDWVRLAGQDILVFAGYNDAVPYAQLVEVTEGQIIRDFLHDEQDPSQNVNKGRLGFEDIYPIQSWAEAATCVDGDHFVSTPDIGILWIFRTSD